MIKSRLVSSWFLALYGLWLYIMMVLEVGCWMDVDMQDERYK
jgi:hypothetical protein